MTIEPGAARIDVTNSVAYRFGRFRLELHRRILMEGEREILLQPRVFELLSYLVRNPGRTIFRNELIAALWPGLVVTDNVLSRAIKLLRKALGDDASAPACLRTVSRVGYVFIAEVAREEPADQRAARAQVVAVLPFRSLLENRSDPALELGMADTLITLLSKMHGLHLRPLDAVRKYHGQPDDPLSAGRDLGAALVVEGTIQQDDRQVRLSSRVHRVSDGSVIMVECCTEPLCNLFELQDILSRRISEALQSQLSLTQPPQRGHRPHPAGGAYRHFLLGRLHWGQHAAGSDERALWHFEQALAIDPEFAQAWTGMADCWLRIGSRGENSRDAYGQARQAASSALALDPEQVSALACMGTVSHALDRDWARAEGYFRKALELAPSDAQALAAFSDFLAYQGRAEEAIGLASQAVEMNPASAWFNAILAQALHIGRLHEDAICQAKRTLELAPDFGIAHFFIGLSCLVLNRIDQALLHLEKARTLTDRADFAGALGFALASTGGHDAARKVLDDLHRRSSERNVPAFAFGLVHAGLGERDEAFDWFNRSRAERSWHPIILHAEPFLAGLRDDPRTIALLKRINIHSRPMFVLNKGHDSVTVGS
jgi:DNA-binding winged helix-turn-helix (wHTH) protein/tetratricopeptide (TPR) repeat protein